MTVPDSNFWLVVLIQAIGYVGLWWRGERRNAIRNFQHGKMWKEYEKQHKMTNGNGDIT